MAFSNPEQDAGDVMSEINMVPLIDIMLVLLIIFIITVPVIKQAVNVNLPQASAEPEKVEADSISLSINASGQYFLDTAPVDDEQLRERLVADADKEPQPALHISGDRDVRYERVARAMALARESGMQKIAFVTDPEGSASQVPGDPVFGEPVPEPAAGQPQAPQ